MALWRRLQEKDGKMDITCLRVLKPQKVMLTLGAVSGSMLYLTSFANPTYGALLCLDLSKPDVEPTVRTCFLAWSHVRKHAHALGVCYLRLVLHTMLEAIQPAPTVHMHRRDCVMGTLCRLCQSTFW